MPVVERPRVEPTDDWQQLQLLAPFPEQHVYELLRPVVLFGRPPAQRADETGTPERTIYRRAVRFDAEGMASLFPPPQVEKHQRLPTKIRAAIRERKAEYPAFRAHEIADICAIRFDQRPNPHTVRRSLAEDPPTPVARRRFPPYRDIADPAEARLAIIRLHSEGWAVKSIPRTYARFRHWKVYGERGLAGKPVGLWPYGPQLTVEHRDEVLAQFQVAYAPGKRQFKAVTLLRTYEMPFRSPQPLLFPLDDAQWLKAFRTTPYAPHRQYGGGTTQLPLFSAEHLAALSLRPLGQ